MDSSVLTQQFTIKDHSLHVLVVSLQGTSLPKYIPSVINDAFSQIAPYLVDSSQVLYMRDIKRLAIDSTYAGGHCYNRSEAMIAVPDWGVDKEQVVAAIHHELHHMARWQNAGYGETLGGAILSEGIATYYEGLRSGWKSPWSTVEVKAEVAAAALDEWDSNQYNHGQWFFEGKHGKWAGYALGTRLAEELFKKGFNLAESLRVTPAQAKPIFKELNKS